MVDFSYLKSTIDNTPGIGKAIVQLAEVEGVRQNDVVNDYNMVDLRIGTSTLSHVHPTDLYFVYSDNNGVFIGAAPPVGNPALAIMEQGNKFHGIKYYAKSDILPKKLEEGQLLLKNNDSNILNFIENKIILGNFDNRGLVLNTALFSSNNNFNHHFSFSEASRSINAMIRREMEDSGYQDVSKLIEDDLFLNKKSQSVSLTSSIDKSNAKNLDLDKISRNPNFVENRKLVYEFEYSSNNLDLQTELKFLLKTSKNLQMYMKNMEHLLSL